MADRYVIPFGTTLEDLQGGSVVREEIADTAWYAIAESVAAEMRHHGGDHAVLFGDVSDLSALYDKGPDNEEMSLYNAMRQSYHHLVGGESTAYTYSEGHAWGGTAGERLYTEMTPEEFQEKFARSPGTNTNQFFEDYVNQEATKWAGHINALIAGVGAAGTPGGSVDPDDWSTPIAIGNANNYRVQMEQATADEEVHIYEMPDLPGRPSAAVANFKEQCFMLGHILKFAEYKLYNVELVERKRLPYQPTKDDSKPTNACVMAHSEPYAFMNKLTQYGTQSTLLNLKEHEISSLVPKIRLFKVFENDKAEEISQEFHFDAFPNSTSLDFLMSDRKKRGVGVGIKDFTFSYEGSNPFSVKKSIFASLELFAASFDELFRHRQDIRGNDYRYVDLALKTGGKGLKNKINPLKGSLEFENLENLNFRIKAVVGWQAPPTKTGASATSFSNAINNSFVTLNLTPKIHKFNIQDDGSVIFSCTYVAYIEDHFEARMFNIFGTEKAFKRQLERKITLMGLNVDCDADQMKKTKEKYKDQAKEDLNDVASSLVQRLIDRELVRYVNIPFSELSDLNKQGPYSKFGKKFSEYKIKPDETKITRIEKMASSGKDLTTAEKKVALNKGYFSMRPQRGANNQNYSCAFFYVSDLIDVIVEGISERMESADALLTEIHDKKLLSLEGSAEAADAQNELVQKEKKAYLQQKEAFKKMRVLLGPIEIVNQQDPKQSKFINMGDLPVSVKYFVEWMAKQTINKASIDYPLPKFLNQFFKDFINTFLNDNTCHKGEVHQRVTLSQAAITSYKRRPDDLTDTITAAIYMVREAKKSTFVSRLDLDNWWPPISGRPTDPWPVLNISGVHNEPIADAGARNEINYLVYYAGRSHPVEKQNGNFIEDKNMGIHHYAIGKDRGLVKNIRMTTTNVPYLKEMRLNAGDFDGLEQLREVYNVEIDCYANVNTFPGTYIYVDPRGFSPTTVHVPEKVLEDMKKRNPVAWQALKEQDLTRFGIGGYYMIKRSEHSFGPGKVKTTIQAQWTHQSGDDEKREAPKSLDKKDTSKCAVGAGGSGAGGTFGGGTSGGAGAGVSWNDAPGESDVSDRVNARNEYAESVVQVTSMDSTATNLSLAGMALGAIAEWSL